MSVVRAAGLGIVTVVLKRGHSTAWGEKKVRGANLEFPDKGRKLNRNTTIA